MGASHTSSSWAPLLSSPPLVAVIRAKAVSAKEVDSGNDIYGNPIKRIQYEIKQIKVMGHSRAGGCQGQGTFRASCSLLLLLPRCLKALTRT